VHFNTAVHAVILTKYKIGTGLKLYPIILMATLFAVTNENNIYNKQKLPFFMSQ